MHDFDVVISRMALRALLLRVRLWNFAAGCATGGGLMAVLIWTMG